MRAFSPILLRGEAALAHQPALRFPIRKKDRSSSQDAVTHAFRLQRRSFLLDNQDLIDGVLRTRGRVRTPGEDKPSFEREI